MSSVNTKILYILFHYLLSQHLWSTLKNFQKKTLACISKLQF